MELLTDQLSAGIDDEEVQLRVLAEIEANLAEMRIRRSLLLQDDPDHVRTFSKRHVADRGYEALLRVRRKMPLDYGRFGTGSERNRKARMRLSMALDHLDFDRSLDLNTGCDRDFQS